MADAHEIAAILDARPALDDRLPVVAKTEAGVRYLGHAADSETAGGYAVIERIAHSRVSTASLKDGRRFYLIRP